MITGPWPFSLPLADFLRIDFGLALTIVTGLTDLSVWPEKKKLFKNHKKLKERFINVMKKVKQEDKKRIYYLENLYKDNSYHHLLKILRGKRICEMELEKILMLEEGQVTFYQPSTSLLVEPYQVNQQAHAHSAGTRAHYVENDDDYW